MNYYKYINSTTVEKMTAPKNISNPTAAQLAAYATANDYKELRETEAPSAYHTLNYEDDEVITQVWIDPDLDDLKVTKKAEAEAIKTAAINYARIAVAGLDFEVIFDLEAQANLLGLLVLGQASDYIDADDVSHELSFEQIGLIATAFATYKSQVYATKAAAYAAINACETVDELLALDNPSEEEQTIEE